MPTIEIIVNGLQELESSRQDLVAKRQAAATSASAASDARAKAEADAALADATARSFSAQVDAIQHAINEFKTSTLSGDTPPTDVIAPTVPTNPEAPPLVGFWAK